MFDDRFGELTRGRPLVLGHRGSPRLAPENSLESFRLALEAGADGVELDVQCTSDGAMVAHHDDALPSGEIIARTPFAELRPAAQKAGYGLPTLAEVFELMAGRGLLNIELKCTGFEAAAVALARERLPRDSFAFSSFDPRAVLACRRAAPDVPAFLIVFGPRHADSDLALLRGIEASGIAFEVSHTSSSLVQFFRTAQYPVFAWTVNDTQEAARLAAAGVTGIITDIPGDIIRLFRPNPPAG